MKRISIGTYVPLLLVGVVTSAIALFGILFYLHAVESMHLEATKRLRALAELRTAALQDYLHTISNDLALLATDETVAEGLTLLGEGFEEIRQKSGDPQSALQRLYIEENPNPVGRKQYLDRANDESGYSAEHLRFHRWLRQLVDSKGYYDVFLITPKGDIVYTVFKELDFATNLLSGPWKDTDLAKVFRGAAGSHEMGATYFADFAPYRPSHGAPASFIATPVIKNGNTIGVLAFQMPIDRINRVMQATDGMGNIARTYIVGQDSLVRSDLLSDIRESAILKRKVDGELIQAALNNQSAQGTRTDESGKDLITVALPLKFADVTWAVVAEADAESLLHAELLLGPFGIALGAAVLVIIGLVGFASTRGITQQVRSMAKIMTRLASGDMLIVVPSGQGVAEMEDMAGAISELKSMSEKRLMLESETKARALAFRQLQERLIDAVETTPDGFAIYDDSDRLVLCNNRYRTFYGESGQLLRAGLQFSELLKASLAEYDAFPDGRTAEEWMKWRMSYRANPTGSLEMNCGGRVVRVTDRRTTDGGTVTMIQDITNDRMRELELRHAREMADKANQAKSDFLSRMSHELRTPLNAILGFAQILHRDRKEPLSANQRKSLEHVINGGQHLLRLINEVLDLARVESGSFKLTIEPLRLESVIDDAAAILKPLAAKADITLVIEPMPRDDIQVLADKTRLKQILLNLGSNAIKYNSAGGSVHISTGAIDSSMIRIKVKDTGQGISPEKQSHLFEPFNRLGAEFGSIEGTGVGLAISEKLASLMQGALGFESEPGRGSTFWVDLPANLASPQMKVETGIEASAIDPAQFGEFSVLYVEDNSASAELMAKLLSEAPRSRLTIARDAETGLRLAQSEQPDVIIMDINLPGMNGFQALQELQSGTATGHIPVVALSAAAMPHDVERGLRAGFIDYLTKPVDVAAFWRCVERALNSAPHHTVD